MSSARRNESTRASIQDQVIIGSGNFRNVYQGTYTDGPRNGEKCVVKEFKSGGVFEDTYFTDDIRAVGVAIKIVDAFIASAWIRRQVLFPGRFQVHVNEAQVWSYRYSRRMCLCEPFIENFEKFNSNSGAMDEKFSFMHALSHFSYHHTNSEQLLCDLQGGLVPPYHYTLTDPVIMSRKKEFGITDLGQTGIENFFYYHKCDRYCDPTWLKMPDAKRYLKPSWNSTMIAQQDFSKLTMPPPKRAPLLQSFVEEDQENYDYFGNATMLNPADIRYCQDSIKRTFIDGRSIDGTKRELERDGNACVDRIPRISVFKKNGMWFTEDNRRLWCFKNASNIHSVPVTKVGGLGNPRKFTTENNGVSVRLR